MAATSLMKATDVARNALSACLVISADSTPIHSIGLSNRSSTVSSRTRSSSEPTPATNRSGERNVCKARPSRRFSGTQANRRSSRPASAIRRRRAAALPTGSCADRTTSAPSGGVAERLRRAVEHPFHVGTILVVDRGVERDPHHARGPHLLGGTGGERQPARTPHFAQQLGQPGLVDRRAVLVQVGHDFGIGVDSDDCEAGLRQAGCDHHSEVPQPHNGDRRVLLRGHIDTLSWGVAAILAAGGTLSRMEASDHPRAYFDAVGEIAAAIDVGQVDAMARGLAAVRERGGRLFIVGVGGGAGHASHAVNDFRKLCLIESYAPTDNVSELTARTNDDGWDTSFTEWLAVSRLDAQDALLVFSVGGGSREHNVSVNVVNAIERAHELGAAVYGVVGAPGGTLAELADVAVVIRAPDHLKTPLVESFQAVVWHALVSHPDLAARQGHWESLAAGQAKNQ